MGLDITAYSRLKHVGHCPDVEEDDHAYDPETYKTRHVRAYAYDSFPHALAGIPDVRTFNGREGSVFLDGGCYAVTPETLTHRFRAGSYGGYNVWRADLAEQFNPYGPRTFEHGPGLDGQGYRTAPSAAGPFYELIWFADNEGTLSAQVAAKLLGQFRTHRATYVSRVGRGSADNDYDIQRYDDWTRACELAADGGLIEFH